MDRRTDGQTDRRNGDDITPLAIGQGVKTQNHDLEFFLFQKFNLMFGTKQIMF